MSNIKNTVTREHLDNLVAQSDVEYAIFGCKLTVAVITLPNKFKVTGEASCVDVNNFNKELGEKYALEAAVKKLWELEGYLLATELQRRADWDASPKIGERPKAKDICSCGPREACSDCP